MKIKEKIIRAGDESEIIRGKLKIAFINLDEGIAGDYDANDPDDMNLLRFDLSEKIGRKWEGIEDGSYCTNFPAKATQKQKTQALRLMMSRLYPIFEWEKAQANQDVKWGFVQQMAQRLSWVGLDWLTKLPEHMKEFKIGDDKIF